MQRYRNTDTLVKYVSNNDVANLGIYGEDEIHSTNFQISSYFSDKTQNQQTSHIPLKSMSLLHVAAYYDSLETFIYLHNFRNINLNTKTANGYNPLHFACYGNSREVAEYIIQKDPKICSIETDTEHQYIYLACCGNAPEILTLLLNHGADLNSRKNKFVDKPIDYAIKAKRIKCLEILLKNLKKSENSQMPKCEGYSPMMLAIINSQPAAVPLLLEAGNDPSIRTADGNTVLSLNCFFLGDVSITEMICNILPDVDIPHGERGLGAVHWICKSKNPEMAKVILRKQIEINRFDKEGYLGPHYLIDNAKKNDALKILNMLYDYGLDLNKVSDRNHNTLLGEFLLAIKVEPEIIDWFLSKNVEIDVPLIKVTTGKNEYTTIRQKLVELATKKPSTSMTQKFYDLCKKYKILK